MAVDLSLWLRAQFGAECAGAGREWPLRALLLAGPYQRLLARGYRLPFFVVCDLSWLYCNGPSALSGLAPVADELAGYSRFMAELARGPAFRDAVQWSLVARRSLPTAPRELPPGLREFLEIWADSFPPSPPDTRWWRELRAAIVSKTANYGHDLAQVVRQALNSADGADLRGIYSVVAYTRTLESVSQTPELGRARDTARLLALAAAVAPNGGSSLDPGLLDTCLRWESLDVPGKAVIERTHPEPKGSHRARSPEPNAEGLLTRHRQASGPRPIELAKPQLVARWALNEILYRERFGPAERPLRVVFAWIIDLGRHVRRCIGDLHLRYDGVSRRLAANMIEDLVQAVAPGESAERRILVLLHNGRSGAGLRGLVIEPTSEELEMAATPEETRGVWWPKVKGSLPFFYRQPEWPEQNPFDAQFSGPGNAWARAVRLVAARADLIYESIDGRDPAAQKADFCLVSLFGMEGDFPEKDDEADTLMAAIRAISPNGALGLFCLGENGLRWRSWPPLAGGSAGWAAVAYGDEGECNARRTFCADLRKRLAGT